MQTYVWGVLISAFLLDVLKNNFSGGGYESESEEKIKNHKPQRSSQPSYEPGMKVKLDEQQDLRVEYEGSERVNKYTFPTAYGADNVKIKVLYCTS